MTPTFGFPSNWTIRAHHDALDAYFKKRVKSKGLQVPRLFESVFCIILAERYRCDGDLKAAQMLLSQAADIDVGNASYLTQIDNITLDNPLMWTELLLPQKEAPDDESASPDSKAKL